MKARTTMPLAPHRHTAPFECRAASRFNESVNAEGLLTFAQPLTSLALWRRFVPMGLEGAFPLLPWENWQDLRITARPIDILAHVGKHLSNATNLKGKEITELANDLALCAGLFSGCTCARLVTLRLECITDDACRLFHADNNVARLVTTYRGIGTQFVDPDTGWRPSEDAREPDASRIQHMQTGDVAIMRGARGSNDARSIPLYHRSPPLSSVAEWRLFAAIDAA